jgi:hypothetical protein
VTAFEYNEDLKECCVLLGATHAITIFFKNGVPIIPETFYETVIVLPVTANKTTITVVIKTIKSYLQKLEENNIFCTDIVVDFKRKSPTIITYTIFIKEKQFIKKRLKYLNNV